MVEEWLEERNWDKGSGWVNNVIIRYELIFMIWLNYL